MAKGTKSGGPSETKPLLSATLVHTTVADTKYRDSRRPENVIGKGSLKQDSMRNGSMQNVCSHFTENASDTSAQDGHAWKYLSTRLVKTNSWSRLGR
jgi:hypothetical protein